MTTFNVYYSARGCVFFTEPYVSIMAVTEDSAREIFYKTHGPLDYTISHIERSGLYANNGRYTKYFKTKSI